MQLMSFLKNKEVKNASWLIAGRIIQMLLSLIVGVLTARYLGPGNYGLISYGGAYVSFFSSLCSLGINSIIIKDFVDNPKEQGEAIGSAIVMRLLASLFSVLIIIGIVLVVDKDEPTTIIVVALCSFGLLFNVFETFNYWFQSLYKSKITAIATLIAYIITSIYKLILLVLNKNIYWFAFATSIDYIVIAVCLSFFYKKYNGDRLKFTSKKAKALLRISYNYIISSMMVAIYGQTDKLMLKQMLDENIVGYYTIATTLCTMWTFVLQAIIDSFYPTILKLKGEDEKQYEIKNRQLYAIIFYVSCIVSILFLFLGGFIIKLLYGVDYLPAVDMLKIITWYTAFSYLGVARNAWIVSEGNQKYLKYIYGCAAILNVVLNFVFIPLWGGVGAAFASLITEVFTSLILPLIFKDMRRNTKLIFEAIFFIKLK